MTVASEYRVEPPWFAMARALTRRLLLGMAAFGTLIGRLSAAPARSSTLVGAVYGERSKLIRRVIVPDFDDELDDPLHVGAGELMLRAPRHEPHDQLALQTRIVARHGMMLADLPCPRVAVVHAESRFVVAAIMADPEIDTLDGHELHRSAVAQVGWQHDGTQFLARYVLVRDEGPQAIAPGVSARLTVPATVLGVVFAPPGTAPAAPEGNRFVDHAAAEIGAEIQVAVLLHAQSCNTVTF